MQSTRSFASMRYESYKDKDVVIFGSSGRLFSFLGLCLVSGLLHR